MRTPFIAANWKMYKTVLEAVAFVKELRKLAKDLYDVEIVIAPPFTALRPAADAAHASNIGIAGQNLHWEREGAFTGEVSAGMLKEAGAEYVIIGHSERRRLFGDTDQTVNRKLLAAIASQLTAIVCIGETLEERDRNETLTVLDRQIKDGLDSVTADQIAGLVIAYEPVWAIGERGIPATADYADARQAEIIAVAEAVLGRKIPCLYGGSVNPQNCEELISSPHIDGLFIGRSAWNVEGYLDILAKCATKLQGEKR